jgi:hypothetical protein
MKNMLVALLALALLPATTFAGGGTKGITSSLTVKNNGSDRLAVILDAPAGFDPKKNTVAQFTAAGGKIVEVGGSITINIKEGTHKFGAAYVSAAGVIGRNYTESRNVPKNTVIQASVIGNAPFTPTVTFTATTK